MSEKENEFIKQLKRFLLGLILIFVPFMLTSIGNMVNDHFKIKTNQQAIKAIKGNYVSNDMLLLYVNTLTKANEAHAKWQQTHDDKDLIKFNELNKKIDELMREIYKSTTRGAPKPDTLK